MQGKTVLLKISLPGKNAVDSLGARCAGPFGREGEDPAPLLVTAGLYLPYDICMNTMHFSLLLQWQRRPIFIALNQVWKTSCVQQMREKLRKTSEHLQPAGSGEYVTKHTEPPLLYFQKKRGLLFREKNKSPAPRLAHAPAFNIRSAGLMLVQAPACAPYYNR